MKVVVFTLLYAALAALSSPLAFSNTLHVNVRFHHGKHELQILPDATETVVAKTTTATKNLYHVSGAKAVFDKLLKKNPQLDVWRIRRVDGHADQLEADILATAATMDSLLTVPHPTKRSGDHPAKRKAPLARSAKLQLKHATTEYVTLERRIENDRKDVASCLYATKGFQLDLVKTVDVKYTESAYFDCFRPFDQIFEFFDTLATENPDFVTKIANISTTFESRSIHAYKIATQHKNDTNTETKTNTTVKETKKKALYTQSLIHAREWQAGAATHYTMASLLDGLRAGDAATGALFDEFDWYFVPLVNIDGYKYSWDTDRYWRVNRHASNGYEGVDLNRNFPPDEFFNADPSDVSAETNPGDAPLSEPEARGIYDFVMGLTPQLAGVVDVHAFGGMVLRPFSDDQREPEEPYGSAMKQMGDAVRDAMSPTDGKTAFQYISQPSGKLYPAYGCVDDAFYRMTNFTVPALTFEVEGTDFIAPQSSIRDVGRDVDHGLRRFAKEALSYHAMIQKLTT